MIDSLYYNILGLFGLILLLISVIIIIKGDDM